MPGLNFNQTPVNQEDFFTSTLNNAFALRKQELETDFSNQSAMLELPVDKQIEQLKDSYRLKEYQLRRSKLTDEDFTKSMNGLIDSYERDELKIRQKADMTLDAARQQLDTQRLDSLAQLEADQHKTMGKVEAINYLMSTGRLPQEEGQQELYKMVGIDYKPKTPYEQYKEINSYIGNLETELRNYYPEKEGWFKDTPMQFDPSGGFGVGLRDATEEEQIQFYATFQELQAARRRRNQINRTIQGGNLRIGRLQNAYTSKAKTNFKRNKEHMRNFDINKNAFVDSYIEKGKSPTALTAGIEQRKPERKQLDKATATKFLQQAGGDKDKARELARQAGYEF